MTEPSLRNRTVLALAEVVSQCFDYYVNIGGNREPRTRPDMLGDLLFRYELPPVLVQHARSLPPTQGVVKDFVLGLDTRGGEAPTIRTLVQNEDDAAATSQAVLRKLAEAVLDHVHGTDILVKPNQFALERLVAALTEDGFVVNDGKLTPQATPTARGPSPASHSPSFTQHRDKSMTNTRIFVSHSGSDHLVAKALVLCLERAVDIPDNSIRCTSVDGYRLQPGAHGSTTLRDNIASSSIVIGLITTEAIRSGYVVMELGAAWGLGIVTAPLLHPSLDFKSIPGPLAETHAVKADNRTGIVDLIGAVAKYTQFKESSRSKQTAAIDDFLQAIASSWPTA